MVILSYGRGGSDNETQLALAPAQPFLGGPPPRFFLAVSGVLRIQRVR